jgi:hypothetical protein
VGVKFGLPPIARIDATLFILGSLPGDASLAARRYYAHPTNQFWRLLGAAIGEELQPLSYEDRLGRLAERRIGLWDVIASASRPGSLDQLSSFPESEMVLAALEDGRSINASCGASPIRRRPAVDAVVPLKAIARRSGKSWRRCSIRLCAASRIAWSRLAQFVTPAQIVAR